MSNAAIVTRSETAGVVHLVLLFNATPLCGRNEGAWWSATAWRSTEEARTLCQHCKNVLGGLASWASLFAGDAEVGL